MTQNQINAPLKVRQYESFQDWFDRWLSQVLCRRISLSAGKHQVFCPQWWEHPEVVVRLQSLWLAWEAAMIDDDGTAMSEWWVHHADPQLRAIMDAERGPMYGCTRDIHQRTPSLCSLVSTPPVGWFGRQTN